MKPKSKVKIRQVAFLGKIKTKTKAYAKCKKLNSIEIPPAIPNPYPEQMLDPLPKDYKLELPKYEEVNHPNHYNYLPNGIECIDVIEHFPANLAMSMKYIWRSGKKPGQDVNKDLKKAIWHLERQIKLNDGTTPRINK